MISSLKTFASEKMTSSKVFLNIFKAKRVNGNNQLRWPFLMNINGPILQTIKYRNEAIALIDNIGKNSENRIPLLVLPREDTIHKEKKSKFNIKNNFQIF